MKRKILLVLLAILVIIQFIRPAKNQSTTKSPTDITAQYSVPATVQTILDKACADCHSNNTYYPWYSNVQPVGWWLANHVNEGKRELNFSDFASYPAKKQHHKLKEIIETVKEGEMPLNSYTWIHKNAILTEQEKLALSQWADSLQKDIAAKNNLPPDTK